MLFQVCVIVAKTIHWLSDEFSVTSGQIFGLEFKCVKVLFSLMQFFLEHE